MSGKRSWDKVDRLAQAWYDLPADGNEAAKKKLEFDVFQAAMEALGNSPQKDALGEFWLNSWQSFDPNKSPLSAYMRKILKFRMEDMRHEDGGMWSQMVVDELDPQGKKTKRVWRSSTSLDESVSDDEGNGTTKGALQSDPAAEAAYADLYLDASAYECLALVLNLSTRLQGKANNADRINYIRLFFTDGVSKFLREDKTPQAYVTHERDLFQAMKETFLDYYLEQRCRTVEEISDSTLRSYGLLVDGRPMEPVTQPLPNDVYLTYLARVEKSNVSQASTISTQRKFYRQFLKEQLC
jgi:hypothetical protein